MVNDFLIQVKQSYLASGKYFQNTSEIKKNPILKAFSAIDPVAILFGIRKIFSEYI